MKLLQLAISSIVDANTGYQLEDRAKEIDYRKESRNAHEIRSRAVSQTFLSLSKPFSSFTQALKNHLKRREVLSKMNHLDEHLLQDIGLSKEDLIAYETGVIELHDLRADLKPETSHDVKSVSANRVKISKPRPALNDNLFKENCCA